MHEVSDKPQLTPVNIYIRHGINPNACPLPRLIALVDAGILGADVPQSPDKKRLTAESTAARNRGSRSAAPSTVSVMRNGKNFPFSPSGLIYKFVPLLHIILSPQVKSPERLRQVNPSAVLARGSEPHRGPTAWGTLRR